MIVVPPIDDSRVATSARRSWNQVLFLPWYPEITEKAVDEMAKLVRFSNLENEPHLNTVASNDFTVQ